MRRARRRQGGVIPRDSDSAPASRLPLWRLRVLLGVSSAAPARMSDGVRGRPPDRFAGARNARRGGAADVVRSARSAMEGLRQDNQCLSHEALTLRRPHSGPAPGARSGARAERERGGRSALGPTHGGWPTDPARRRQTGAEGVRVTDPSARPVLGRRRSSSRQGAPGIPTAAVKESPSQDCAAARPSLAHCGGPQKHLQRWQGLSREESSLASQAQGLSREERI